jgi:hypothetical protein
MRFLIIALAVAAAFVPFVPSARAQGLDPQAVALTAADVPGTMRLSRSGATTRGGGSAYEVFFEASDAGRASESGSIVQIINVVALPSDPTAGITEFMQSARSSSPGGITEQGPQPVGEESGSFTSTMGFGPFTGSTAGTVFRRGGAVVAVMVRSSGGTPALTESVAMAQLIDARMSSGQ